MRATPKDSNSDDRGDDVTSDSSVTPEGAGVELGATEGGSTFEPEEDPEGNGEDQP
jgi:hypothetical protein